MELPTSYVDQTPSERAKQTATANLARRRRFGSTQDDAEGPPDRIADFKTLKRKVGRNLTNRESKRRKPDSKKDVTEVEKHKSTTEPDVWVGTLYKSDRDILATGLWLNSSIVNAAQILIKKAYPSQGLQIHQTIKRVGSPYPCSDIFLQILNVNTSHWLTISTEDCPPGTVHVYDSMGKNVTLDTKLQIAAIMQTPLSLSSEYSMYIRLKPTIQWHSCEAVGKTMPFD